MAKLTRVTPILIVTIFVTSLLMVPTVFISMNAAAAPIDFSIPAQIPHEARVAIYNEANVSVPVGATPAINNSFTNNLNEIETLLEGAGHTVTLLDEQDILDHQLMTADYDVFLLVNNVPRESIANHVYEFWLGGGGLLTFNKAFSYLSYQSIIWPGLGLDGYGLLWQNLTSDVMNVTARHPTMKDYHINDTISESESDWTAIPDVILESSPVWNQITPLIRNVTDPMWIHALAMDSTYQGGRLVHLPGDGSSIPTAFESIIIDSVEWLIPKPKGRIVYDLTHQARLSVDDWDGEFTTFTDPLQNYGQFRTLAVNHSYTFDKLYPSTSGNLTAERLAKYDVLVIDWPDLDYTSAERTAVDAWVAGGGSLLILGDRTGLGGAPGDTYINQLIQNFDMSLGTTDELISATMTPGTHVTLEGCTGLYMGQRNFLSVIGNATSIWFDGTDPVVAGQEYGQGRAILSADMNIFANSQLNVNNNEQFALNVLNWLTAASAEILVYSDYLTWNDAPCKALRDMGISYQYFYTRSYLQDFIDSKDWELLIYNCVNYITELLRLDELYAYVDDGGRLLMTYWDFDDVSTHPLWSKLGVEFASSLSGQPSMYLWDASHPIFSEPNDHSAFNFTSDGPFGDDGDAVTVRAGYTAIAGITADVQDGKAAIVVSADKQTLVNAFVIDNFNTDEDDSTYADNVELWENEIVFMMSTGDTPFPIDPLTLVIIGAVVVGIIVIGVLASRRRGGSSAPAKKPTKKTTKKKK